MITDLQYIKGIGPKRALALQKAGLGSIPVLLSFFPRKYLDRSNIVPLSQLSQGSEVTIIGKIETAGIRRGRRPIFYLIVSDSTGYMEALWFNYVNQYKTMFKTGEWISLSGKVTYYRGYQMIHPDYDRLGDGDLDGLQNTGKIIPVYPGSEDFRRVGLNSYTFRKIFQILLASHLDTIKENLPEEICRTYKFPDRQSCFREIHSPGSMDLLHKSITRLKYEEFVFIQLMLALQKKHFESEVPGYSFVKASDRLAKLYKQLPFRMTPAQERVVREIRRDMKKPHPMNRLLQGDVGSGKTLVAVMAMLIAVDNGYQAALMVPTEVLAEQHWFNFSRMLKDLDVEISLLTKRSSNEQRLVLQEKLQLGQPHIVIGTHALIQESVSFANLGLIVIDEQHRFGVLQRGELRKKGNHPDVLVMTATPIPRTLALTVYGNLDVSILDELPPGRRAIQTVWRQEDKTREIIQFIRTRVQKGEQVYIVYPLIEESEKIDLKAARESFMHYKNNDFKDFNISLMHGRLPSEEKERIMRAFTNGHLDILFSTTVIEVGVDVPNATIMLIEHAERFGLSQLHQLRGRVGRSNKKSYCILKTPAQISETARARLKIMTETNDGFRIAEEDLTLRGWGEFFGTRQHGLPAFKLANPLADNELLKAARQDAFKLVDEDPHLRSKENSRLKYYFTENYADKIAYYKIG
jgi:ATP-dependent DNA helicase RecG